MRSPPGLLCPPQGDTHPDRLLAQPAAPRHVGPRLRRRVVGEREQRLELLRLTVGEHRPHPGLLPRLRLRGRVGHVVVVVMMVPVVTRQRRSIW